MKRIAAGALLLATVLFATPPVNSVAASVAVEGPTALIRGSTIVQTFAAPGTEACKDTIEQLDAGQKRYCRTEFNTTAPPSVPATPAAPSATLTITPASLPAGGGSITIAYSCEAGTATLSGLGQTYQTGQGSGSFSGPVTQSTTIVLACSGGGSASVGVNVASAPAPDPTPTPTPDPVPSPTPSIAGFYLDMPAGPTGAPVTICGGAGSVMIGGTAVQVLDANASLRPGITCQRVKAQPGVIAVGGVDTGMSYTINTGDILYVSLAGNDSTAVRNDPARPWRHVQGGSAGSGAVGVAKPGDVVMLRGGDWNDTGWSSAFLRLWSEDGKPGQYIAVTCYPGEVCNIKGPIMGAASAKRGVSGRYFIFSNLRVTGGNTSDAAPINAQYASDGWRIVNNDLSWPNAPSSAKAGGFTSNSANVALLGNNIHDIGGPYENHGVYLAEGSNGDEVGANRIAGINLGNGIQTFNGSNSNCIDGIRLHDNLVEDGGRYGLNIASGTCGLDAWNNVVRRSAYAGLRFDIPNWYPVDLKVRDSTFESVNTKGSPSSQAMLNCDGQLTNGTAVVQNSTFTPGRSGVHPYDSTGAGCPNLKLVNNTGLQ